MPYSWSQFHNAMIISPLGCHGEGRAFTVTSSRFGVNDCHFVFHVFVYWLLVVAAHRYLRLCVKTRSIYTVVYQRLPEYWFAARLQARHCSVSRTTSSFSLVSLLFRLTQATQVKYLPHCLISTKKIDHAASVVTDNVYWHILVMSILRNLPPCWLKIC